MIRKELEFIKENGQKIAALAFVPNVMSDAKVDIKYPTVIFSHGYNGNYKLLEHHGAGFAENNIVCIFFDFCGGGLESKSDGNMLEMTVLTEIDDLLFVVDQVSHLPYVDSQKIFLQGESMGGFVSACVASKIPDKIKAMILWYPAFVIPDGSRERYEANDNTCFGIPLSPEFNKTSMDLDIYSIIKNYEGRVLIIHGDKDEIVPISYSEKALKSYKNASLTVIKNAGHGYEGNDSIKARELSIEFVKSES